MALQNELEHPLEDQQALGQGAEENLQNLEAEVKPAVVLPEKFKGKSVEDIIASYTELEKQTGKQANELGELRRLTDNILRNGLPQTQHTPEAKKEVSEEDFLENPVETVRRVVDEAISPLRQEADALKVSMTLERLQKLHPNMVEMVSSEEFQSWVMSSPVRQSLWARASEGDFDYANEIFNMYKSTTNTSTRTVESSEDSQETSSNQPVAPPRPVDGQALEAARELGKGASSDSRAGKPVYSRQALIRLMNEDPQKYAANQTEIMAAYAEGRVKP